MSSIILPYGRSIVETFYRPAIVKPHNIMPVKRIITDLTEAAAITTREWVLCKFTGTTEMRWMSKYDSETIKFKHDVVKSLPVEMTHRDIDITVRLMQAAPGSAVIWGLPSDFRK
jgi:hypothetical protein